ncbi:MAG: UDP-N-acetylmuramate:L-alanyl-gamma-D-glutamyl-meso-diaminopimelate ligase [Pyrinomonadaceae bacterium MAG19_C2-C3]|nr:UDP-N-acetylmuramate:L-alanyl-gamma-D-glutamyl-meso-diaminopimelate ligase [Pyrinomonadaceae bacterium MAG19_C2-C3]
MHYHLIGICGTAMASLAGMLKARGHHVTGSDQNVYPPMSTMLADLNIEVMHGYAPQHLEPAPDIVVIGNAMSRGNVEVEAVLNRRLSFQSQAETVKREFINGKRSLVAAGTHGKTTTTSIAAHVLEVGGVHPGFLVGGVVQNFNSSFRVTDSDYFVIEGDEYDTAYFDKQSKFMHYLPELCIVGNIEFDHADIYPNLDAIKLAFRRLMNLVPGNGRLIAGWDDANVRDVVNNFAGKLHTQIETFGLGDDCRWQARDIDFSGEMTRFTVTRDGASWSEIETPLIGEFNVRNCLACIVAASAWGITPEKIKQGLRTFENVKRRMQIRGRERGVTVIDDFAHHPTAVRATLEALRAKQKEGRIVAVFEPRSATSRLKIFQADYARAFTAADIIIIADVFKSQNTANTTNELLDTAQLVRDIAASGKPAEMIAEVNDIVRRLVQILRPADTVAIMSNGGFGGIHDKLLAALREMT